MSSSIGERLNRQRVLGVDLSLLRIRDKIPRTYEAQILGIEKGGVFSWGEDEQNTGKEEFYFLSPIIKETQSGISTLRI